MKEQIKGEVFLKYLNRVIETDLDSSKKISAYHRLFSLMIEHLSDHNNIQFTSLFSRIAYIKDRLDISGKHVFLLHTWRRAIEHEKIDSKNVSDYLILARYNIEYMLTQMFSIELKPSISHHEVKQLFIFEGKKRKAFYPLLTGVATELDIKNKSITYLIDEDELSEVTIKYDVSTRNDNYTEALESMATTIPFPIHINLMDVEVWDNEMYVPKAFIILPDYVLDVTSIAQTFQYYGTEPYTYILNKLTPKPTSHYILLGNIANYLLDELIHDVDVSFQELVPKIFQLSPLSFCVMSDQQVLDVINKSKRHFHNLRKTIRVDFPKEAIEKKRIYLEPSFISRDYGIQGRLDILHQHPQGHHFDIVELKSGSPYMPNDFGLSSQHYIQTLLYDLVVKSSFRGSRKTSNYILYSKEPEWSMRNAPVLKIQQYEALKTRNEMILLEKKLARPTQPKHHIFNEIILSSFKKPKGFLKDNIVSFQKKYTQLPLIEKQYVNHFSAFVAREHHLAKVGIHGLSRSNGYASLWLESRDEKIESFALLDRLNIHENHTIDSIPTLVLRKSKDAPELSRFRKGDIVVLYPTETGVLYNQVFKCNIIDVTSDQITLKLRSQQHNQDIFTTYTDWSIEGDVMDSSFNSMYRNLSYFMTAAPEWRSLWLGINPPATYTSQYDYHHSELTEEQNHLLNKMINSIDYYLLWGPPGTGKTSKMVKHYVKYLEEHTDYNVLILGYTNRAVDELCAAVLDALDGDIEPFLRVGSSNACDPKYIPFLLDQEIKQYSSRKEIRNRLMKSRIILSTVASISNRSELFDLLSFDVVIIDEASQILEPMIIGLLQRFKKVVLIGDHKQLPAVVTQPPVETVIDVPELIDIEISDLRVSLFERLIRRAEKQGWSHAYGQLTAQGRMHEEIMDFPNHYFYNNRLQTIAGIDRLTSQSSRFLNARCIYIPSNVDALFSWKTNSHEAAIILQLIIQLQEKGPYLPEEIGIITPYRAQIALIRKQLLSLPDQSYVSKIMVDTVERYQGGAKDLIILSLCTNRLDQMEQLVSLSEEGIDRKLNVALTRAREQIIIIGNKEILNTNPVYSDLIKAYTQVDNDAFSGKLD